MGRAGKNSAKEADACATTTLGWGCQPPAAPPLPRPCAGRLPHLFAAMWQQSAVEWQATNAWRRCSSEPPLLPACLTLARAQPSVWKLTWLVCVVSDGRQPAARLEAEQRWPPPPAGHNTRCVHAQCRRGLSSGAQREPLVGT